MAAATMTFGLFDNSDSLIRKFHLPFSKFDATAAPGAGNDDSQGYVAGSLWVDRNAHKVYVCQNNATSAAVWAEIPGSGGGGSGTVTSVDASGGSTGLTFSGGPVTGSGTLTLAGTLGLANGGTGADLSMTGAGVVLNSGGGALTVSSSGVAALTNNITSGGTPSQLDDWSDLNTYSNDAAAIRNAIYQVGQKVTDAVASLRSLGIFT